MAGQVGLQAGGGKGEGVGTAGAEPGARASDGLEPKWLEPKWPRLDDDDVDDDHDDVDDDHHHHVDIDDDD
eukprot:230203-Lingulodinium_polyedra.AAC.1